MRALSVSFLLLLLVLPLVVVSATCTNHTTSLVCQSYQVPACRWNGAACETGNPLTGNITYGPGIYGITLPYVVEGFSIYPLGSAGVDYVCNATDANATTQVTFSRVVCKCSLCWAGPLCNLPRPRVEIPPLVATYRWYETGSWVLVANPGLYLLPIDRRVTEYRYIYRMYYGQPAEFQVFQTVTYTPAPREPAVCYTDTLPLASKPCAQLTCRADQQCVRQTDTGPSVPDTYVPPPSDICCPYGYIGNKCEIAVGCAVAGCLHGGRCITNTTGGVEELVVRPEETYCEGCPRGNTLVNATTGNVTVVHGFRGRYCEISNDDGLSPKRYPSANGGGSSRRLLSSHSEVLVPPSRPALRTCDCGVDWAGVASVNLGGQALTAFPFGILQTGNHGRTYAHTLTSILSPVGYSPQDTTHLPVFLRPTGPDALAEGQYLAHRDAFVDGLLVIPNRGVVFWSYTIGMALTWARIGGATGVPQVFPTGTHAYEIQRATRRRSCTNTTLDAEWYYKEYAGAVNLNVTRNSVVGNTDVDGSTTPAADAQRATLHWRLFGHLEGFSPNPTCDMLVLQDQILPYCNYTIPLESFVFSTPNITDTCAPIHWVNDTRFDIGVDPETPTQTGIVRYDRNAASQPECVCRVPFEPSHTNNTDCAATLCGAHGVVNTTWLAESTQNSTAVPEACTCLPSFVTDPASCSGHECKWCQNTVCLNLGKGDPASGACTCSAIFTGDRCEVNLCHPNNTYRLEDGGFNMTTKYNASLGYDTFFCECKSTYYGTFCQNQCVHGKYDELLQTCLCNTRTGWKGPSCAEEICATDNIEGAGQYVFNATLGEDLGLTDSEVGSCDCFAPWTGLDCRSHTCNTNLRVPEWGALMPFGSPVFDAEENVRRCQCQFPFRGINDSLMDCGDYSCGFGVPDPLMTLQTLPAARCLCDAQYIDIGVHTRQDCSGDLETCQPCSLGMCRVNVSQALLARPLTTQDILAGRFTPEPCCVCDARYSGAIGNQTCVDYCVDASECVTGPRSGFYLLETTGMYVCDCNINFANANGSLTNECLECATGWYSTDPLVEPQTCDSRVPFTHIYTEYPPLFTPSDGGDSSATLVDGLTDAQLIGISSVAGAFVLISMLAAYANTVMGTVATAKTVASAVMPGSTTTTTTTSTTTVRTKGEARLLLPRHRMVLSVLMLCMLVSVVMGQVDPRYGPGPSYDDGLWTAANTLATTPLNPAHISSFDSAGVNQYAKVTIALDPRWIASTGSNPTFTANAGDCHPTSRTGPGPMSGGYMSDTAFETPAITRSAGDTHCGFNPAGAAYTATFGTQIGVTQADVTWSRVLVQVNTFSIPVKKYYEYAINMCVQDSDCGGGGVSQCVAYLGRLSNGAAFGSTQEVYNNDNILEISTADPNTVIVRGCKCRPGKFGPTCTSRCPDTSEAICSGRGTCGTATTTTTVMKGAGPVAPYTAPDGKKVFQSWFHTCSCPLPARCTCNPGFTGPKCEIAVQANTLERGTANVQNNVWCCPYDALDCDTLSRNYNTPCTLTSSTGTPPNPFSPMCTSPASSFAYYTRHTPRPRMCGEQTPSLNRVEGQGDVGAGQCVPNFKKSSAARCWCNTGDSRNFTTPVGVPKYQIHTRRGWFGDNCQKQTCTELSYNVPSVDGTHSPTGLITVAKPCSGNQHPRWPDNSQEFCNDTVIELFPATSPPTYLDSSINTPGVCRECANGWGGYTGINPVLLENSEYHATRTGLCNRQTFHSNGGSVCGGYGVANLSATTVTIRYNTNPITSRAIYPVTNCTCFPPQSRYYGNTNICQRTCIPDVTELALEGGIVTDSEGSIVSIGKLPSTQKCSGRGLCYAIQGPGLIDGFNSACVCNAGWNGHDCSKEDVRFFDTGFQDVPGPPRAASLCSSHADKGIAVLQDLGSTPTDPYLDTAVPIRPQRDYFLRRVMPLNGTAMNSITAYTAFHCQCKDPTVNGLGYSSAYAGWGTNNTKGVCARTCFDLNDCNSALGQGTCISSPFGGSMDKGCRCKRGFGGEKCELTILRDALNRVCGGNSSGLAVYTNTFRVAQQCMCVSGYTPLPSTSVYPGVCAKPCPLGRDPTSTSLLACTHPSYGTCDQATAQEGGADQLCRCNPGRTGRNCNTTDVASVKGPITGLLYTCTHRGTVDAASGLCMCNEGYVGPSCEVDDRTLQCGYGQPYQDSPAIGITVVNAQALTPITASSLSKVGQFDHARYFIAYSTVMADLDAGSSNAWRHYTRSGIHSSFSLHLTNGYSARWNLTRATEEGYAKFGVPIFNYTFVPPPVLHLL